MDSSWEHTQWSGFMNRALQRLGPAGDGGLVGVGSFFTGFGPRPLALVDAQLAPWRDEVPAAMPVVPAASLGPDARLPFEREDAPPELLVMYVRPPEPLAGFDLWVPQDAKVISSPKLRERGTLGPRVELDGRDLFMTAGHLLAPPGSAVDVAADGLLRSRRVELGSVVYRADPADDGRPGYDVGLIDVDLHVNTLPHKHARLGQEQEAPYPVSLEGGRSGRQHGFIQGALRVLSDADGVRRWLNCWMLMPGHIAAEGDSGAAVLGPDEEVVGVLVGGSRMLNSRAFAVLYVHDLECLLTDLPPDGYG